jgi:hypothetical protein
MNDKGVAPKKNLLENLNLKQILLGNSYILWQIVAPN